MTLKYFNGSGSIKYFIGNGSNLIRSKELVSSRRTNEGSNVSILKELHLT
jgi:hypothetical protein